MADGLHTREQGLRVHHLANLGGLVAIAGLDREPPDLLLGGLLELAARLPDLPCYTARRDRFSRAREARRSRDFEARLEILEPIQGAAQSDAFERTPPAHRRRAGRRGATRFR